MIFEIINPSDKYTLESDDFEVACVTNVFIGEGRYGLTQVDGEGNQDMPILFIGADKWFQETFGSGPDEVIKRCIEEKRDALIAALESVLIGGIKDRRTYNDGLALIDDKQKRQEWRDRWHEKRRSSLNNIGSVAYKYAEALRKGM